MSLLSFLLSVTPYVAGAALSFARYRATFSDLDPPEGEAWRWDFIWPILITSMTPLAVASERSVLERNGTTLIGASVLSILLCVLVGLVVQRTSFFLMTAPMGLGRWEFPWLTRARLAIGGELAAAAVCAAVTVGAAQI